MMPCASQLKQIITSMNTMSMTISMTTIMSMTGMAITSMMMSMNMGMVDTGGMGMSMAR